ncbi:MAG: ketoacyl-ACP synthase III [Actinomycetota bacterium]|nr:ketoacyl-ACP synthase III [Actinomycetota bacterium]
MSAAVQLRTAPGAAGARILGMGSHRPDRVVSNEEFLAHMDTSDEWIRSRTGIVSRHWAGSDEGVVDMSAAAASKALAAAGIAPDQVDLVVLATCTYPYHINNASAQVATAIGTQGAGAADVSAACAGFCYALSWGADAIRSGSARYVVAIGAEKISDFLDLTDRGSAFIFGDGAGAAVLGPADVPGVGPVAWGSDGTQNDAIRQEPSTVEALRLGRQPVLAMNGTAVYRWATSKLAPVARRACELAGVELADLAGFIPHQANLRITDSLVKSLELGPGTVVARDIVDTGNTSAASVPLALARMVERGEIRTGDPVLLFAFGAGLTYAGQVIACP